MFLGVALVCPAFLNLLEQISMRNCECWCSVQAATVIVGVFSAQKFFARENHGSPFFCSLNVTSEITPKYVALKRCYHMMVSNTVF